MIPNPFTCASPAPGTRFSPSTPPLRQTKLPEDKARNHRQRHKGVTHKHRVQARRHNRQSVGNPGPGELVAVNLKQDRAVFMNRGIDKVVGLDAQLRQAMAGTGSGSANVSTDLVSAVIRPTFDWVSSGDSTKQRPTD